MKAGKIQLKDITSAVSMDFQPVCLSTSTAVKYTEIVDEDEKNYYNSVCDFARRSERLSETEFMTIVEKYGNYYVWDISVCEDDFGTPYLIISVVKTKPPAHLI